MLRIEFQLNVPIDTMNMTATSAGIGVRPTLGPRAARGMSRVAPAAKIPASFRGYRASNIVQGGPFGKRLKSGLQWRGEKFRGHAKKRSKIILWG